MCRASACLSLAKVNKIFIRVIMLVSSQPVSIQPQASGRNSMAFYHRSWLVCKICGSYRSQATTQLFDSDSLQWKER